MPENSEPIVAGVSIDTRTIKPGELFIALKGKRFDGHQFVEEAFSKGAAAVMVEKGQAPKHKGVVVAVPDTRVALLSLAQWYREQLKVRVVAITGSNGKTTTKEMLAKILESRFSVVKAPASYNNDIGVPLTVMAMDSRTDIAIFEIEMNELGGTLRLAKVCQPEIGLVTNIGDTHLEFMKDRSGVAQEKAELLEALPENGVAVVNFDDPLVMEIADQIGRKKRLKLLTFGFNRGADVYATDVVVTGVKRTRFLLVGKYPVELPVLGQHNIANLLAASAAANVLGVSFSEIGEAIKDFCPAPQRLAIRKLNGVLLIDDCFNANPQSVAAALAVLGSIAPPEKRVAILADMLELGEKSEVLHREVGVQAARCVNRLVVIGEKAQFIAEAAVSAGLKLENIKSYQTVADVGPDLFDFIKPNDTILVKGSRAMALENVVEKIVRHYGEKTD
ncbi:UDP-N-acetylmuramoyl-tripeptide--D-alanyl-D-alanine ligase [candidate division WOR-3 bacterium]|nr:UDP-N-acetylmuramoyl-tripeptide--D-alanyl-D-alanine ligase [candidate division WOR-3 bacterium]